jgi:CheY-like chemotaxis protein
MAAAAAQGGDTPRQQDDGQDLETRSLRVLIVEDEFFISLHTKGLLQALGHVVVAVAVSADQAVSLAGREKPDVIEAAEDIRSRFGIGSIFVTANTDPHTRQRAEATRPLGILEKPLTEQRLRLGLARFI